MSYMLETEITILLKIFMFTLRVWIKTIDKMVKKHVKLCLSQQLTNLKHKIFVLQ